MHEKAIINQGKTKIMKLIDNNTATILGMSSVFDSPDTSPNKIGTTGFNFLLWLVHFLF